MAPKGFRVRKLLRGLGAEDMDLCLFPLGRQSLSWGPKSRVSRLPGLLLMLLLVLVEPLDLVVVIVSVLVSMRMGDVRVVGVW